MLQVLNTDIISYNYLAFSNSLQKLALIFYNLKIQEKSAFAWEKLQI